MTDLKTIIRDAIEPSAQIIGIKPSKESTVMLLAIGLQESRFVHRRQLVGNPPQPTGPAKSFWQAEQGGGMVHGVRRHADTSQMAAELCKARKVSPNDRSVWDAIENDDVLAAGLARLLLWTDPKRLPALGDAEGAWQLYLRTWRPGKPHRGTWDALYAKALEAVQ
ncbi:MAG: hypothetical protein [Bacteriophage sp.]|nr:MAG: hypothetical protein [Bacteriophage sp.]